LAAPLAQRRPGLIEKLTFHTLLKIAEMQNAADDALAPLELEGELAVDRLPRAKSPK